MRRRRLDDLAAAAEDLVAELEDAQIGPGPRAQANHFPQRFVGRPVGACLRQDEDRRGGRSRHSGVAMNEKMRLPQRADIARKGEQQLDIPALGRDPAGMGFDHIVKAELQAPFQPEAAQRLRLGPARIEDRQDMGDAARAMAGDLVDPADRHLERHQLAVCATALFLPVDLGPGGHASAELWQFCAANPLDRPGVSNSPAVAVDHLDERPAGQRPEFVDRPADRHQRPVETSSGMPSSALTSSSQRMWFVVMVVPSPSARQARRMFWTAGYMLAPRIRSA